MELIAFVGPSLGGVVPEDWPGIEFRPPAECGDIARAAALGPRAIGLIDGYFETCASPWHKEILWVLSKGIAVIGGASLGALRAAELADFGMRGVGQVFAAYRAGILDDDAEVAVLHGPAELGYPCLTEALVNVRATLARALAEGVVTQDEERRLRELAAAIFYKDRSWAHMRERAVALMPDRTRLAVIFDWLVRNRLDVKREDALEVLSVLASTRSEPPDVVPRVPFTDTSYFTDLRRRLGLTEPRTKPGRPRRAATPSLA
jgi:hypothetical protein